MSYMVGIYPFRLYTFPSLRKRSQTWRGKRISTISSFSQPGLYVLALVKLWSSRTLASDWLRLILCPMMSYTIFSPLEWFHIDQIFFLQGISGVYNVFFSFLLKVSTCTVICSARLNIFFLLHNVIGSRMIEYGFYVL